MAKKPVSISIRKPPPTDNGVERKSKNGAESAGMSALATARTKSVAIAEGLKDAFVRELTMRLPDDIAKQLEEYCREHHRVATDVVLDAVRAYVGTGAFAAKQASRRGISVTDDDVAWNDVVRVIGLWLRNMRRSVGFKSEPLRS